MLDGPRRSPRWWLDRRIQWMLWLLAGLMVAQAAAKIALGVHGAVVVGADIDLQQRLREYALFRDGFYPHRLIELPPAGTKPEHTVYPPYAFPMMAAFFEPGGLMQARAVVIGLSFASLALMALLAFHALRGAGPAVAAIGAAMAFAISGNRGAFEFGQFSIPCVGLLMLQVHLIGKGRPVLAGLCWSLAMLKPHVALPFAVLFLLRRQWPGLPVGLGVLGLLSWAACAWTAVSPLDVAGLWFRTPSINFRGTGFIIGPATLGAGLGIDGMTVQYAVLTAGLCAAIAIALLVRRLGSGALLPLAGLAGVAGMLGFYHRLYDQIMLFPMLLAVFVWAARSARPAAGALAAATLATLLVPLRVYDDLSLTTALAMACWIAAGIYPLAGVVREDRRSSPVPA